jgi:hypothetical protein
MDTSRFFMVPTWITRELLANMKPGPLAVLLTFYQLADEGGYFKISQRRLVERTRLVRSYVQTVLGDAGALDDRAGRRAKPW